MTNSELYLYGTLLALAQEQSEAIGKLTTGGLGFFGKSRIQSRGREIGKFVDKIAKAKSKQGHFDRDGIAAEIRQDLQSVQNGERPEFPTYSQEIFDMIGNYL